MVSLRGTATPANVEAGSDDYSAVDAKYTDAFIEDNISASELDVEGIVGGTLSASSIDRYKRAVILITRMRIFNEMLEDENVEGKKIENFITDDVLNLLQDKRVIRTIMWALF